jgi:hypothetical protein
MRHVYWIHLPQNRDQLQTLVNTTMDLCFPQISVEFLECLSGFSRTQLRLVIRYA